MYLAGALLMAFNIAMTILGRQRDEETVGAPVRSLQPAE